MNMIRKHVMVTGRVQGVGYRYFVLDKAQELDLTGWVRNTPDQSVELEAQGPEDRVSAFIQALQDGPPLARVDQLRDVSHPVVSGEHRFEIAH